MSGRRQTSGRRGRRTGSRRGQLVVLSGAVVAVALAGVLLAYLQLGAHPDVAASTGTDEPVDDARRLLAVGVSDAADGVAREYAWSERDAAVDAVTNDLDPVLTTLDDSGVERGTVYRTSYDRAAARSWAGANCPSGAGRQFGPCEAEEGVVVQERAGRTNVLAVAVEVRVTTERGRTTATLVIRP